jgi:hypothetical protein
MRAILFGRGSIRRVVNRENNTSLRPFGEAAGVHDKPAHSASEIGFDDRSADPHVRLQRAVEEPPKFGNIPAPAGEVEKARTDGVGAADMKLPREPIADASEREPLVYDDKRAVRSREEAIAVIRNGDAILYCPHGQDCDS